MLSFKSVVVILGITILLLVASLCASLFKLSAENQVGYSPLSPDWPESITVWKGEIETAASKYDLPSDIIAAIIMMESGGREDALSDSRSYGLMQVSSAIADRFAKEHGLPVPTEGELLMGPYNIDLGTAILASFLPDHSREGLMKAIMSYGPVDESERYLDWVLSIHDTYAIQKFRPGYENAR